MKKERIILITGATSGFGKRAAEYIASKGYTVFGTGRRAPEGSIENNVHLLRMDVTDPDSVQRAVERIISKHGKIDVLINNAGSGIAGSLEMASTEDIHLQMDTNFYGTVNVTKAVLPHMRRARNGRIICISSIAGCFSIPYQGYYSASKFAIEGFCEALAIEVRRFGIRVAIVEPGDFKTGFTSARKSCTRTLEEPDYAESFRKTLASIEKDEQENGADPIRVARLLLRLSTRKHIRFRNKVGPFIQVIFAKIVPILPDALVSRLVALFYSIPFGISDRTLSRQK